MQKILSSLLICLFFISIGCDCAGTVKGSELADDIPLRVNYIQDKDARRDYVKYITDRTVSISRDCEPKDPDYVMLAKEDDQRGSGVILKSLETESYILTAAHLASKSMEDPKDVMTCSLRVAVDKDPQGLVTNHPIEATVVFSDTVRDEAIIKVEVNLKLSTEIDLDPVVGDYVTSAGFGVIKANSSITKLSISSGELASVYVDVGKMGSYHRVTSQIYFGNSGGGVWSSDRKLLGIVIGMHTEGGVPYEGQYYIKTSKDIIKLIKDHRLDYLL